MMQKLLLGAAISLVAVSSAVAADLSVNRPVYTKEPLPPPPFSWSGFYVGGNFGGKWAETTPSVAVAPATAFGAGLPTGAVLGLGSTNVNTFLGGGQIGFNYQSGQVVFGIEADLDAQHWTTTQVLTGFAFATTFVPGDFFTAESRWQASLRGRLGYAWDRYLLYATGGVAWTRVTVGTNFITFLGSPATFASDNAVVTGGTFGGGLEYALWNNLSIGVEGRFTWYGSHAFSGGTLALGVPPFAFPAVTQTVSLNTTEVVERINWKF
jgi:outer membrane immunogenic protein